MTKHWIDVIFFKFIFLRLIEFNVRFIIPKNGTLNI